MAHRLRQCAKALRPLSRSLELKTPLLCTPSNPPSSHPASPSTFNSINSISRGFASGTATRQSLADQQFSVIAPSGAGGPILRTPVYAIFELGSKQYKVSPGDVIWVERLKLVDIGAQLAFNRVQVAGSTVETIVGRPYVENASVTAVVEEQVQDAKVIIFKKRRRKNSRRLKGHRQMLTGLRITGVNGIMAPKTAKPQVVIG